MKPGRPLALAYATLLIVTNGAAAQETCQRETIGSVRIATIIDGRTFTLDDGRMARLAGIELPPASGNDGRVRAAKAALASLLSGQTITLKRSGIGQDRYGRLLVYAFRENKDDESVNVALLAAGYGRAMPGDASKVCAAPLFAAEAKARAAGLGLWADPFFAPLQAEVPEQILAARGRFALVEGKVLSVREAGATIYVNFGRRWSRDFTVTILKRNRRIFMAAGVEPKAFEGHRIRVRGVIERRGGPIIEAVHPEQIEVIE
jgi:endonuclease YncB( thermonuclease family)